MAFFSHEETGHCGQRKREAARTQKLLLYDDERSSRKKLLDKRFTILEAKQIQEV